MQKQKKIRLLILLIFIFISGCQTSNIEQKQTATNEGIIEPTSTAILEPTATSLPKNVFLITNQTTNSQLLYEITPILEQFSNQNGYIFSKLDTMNGLNTNNSDILIFVQTDSFSFNESEGTNSSQVIIFTEKIIQNSENIVQIKLQKAQELFLSGYLSSIIANDWRIGGILSTNTENDTSYAEIFENGAHYFCGRCTPIYSPIVSFPQTSSINSPTEVMQAYAEIESSKTYVVFVMEQFFTQELYTNLKQNSRTIIANGLPNDNAQFVADVYVHQDFATPLTLVLENYQEYLGKTLPTKLKILDQSEKISKGKENFIQETIEKLENGTISPFRVPLP